MPPSKTALDPIEHGRCQRARFRVTGLLLLPCSFRGSSDRALKTELPGRVSVFSAVSGNQVLQLRRLAASKKFSAQECEMLIPVWFW